MVHTKLSVSEQEKEHYYATTETGSMNFKAHTH